MCKSKGRRKLWEGAGEEVRVEYQNICFSAALADPGAPLQWGWGGEALQVAVWIWEIYALHTEHISTTLNGTILKRWLWVWHEEIFYMKLLKDLWVLSNNHLNVLESLPICFPLASWQLGFACHLISSSRHPAYLHTKCGGSPWRNMHYGVGISLSNFKNVHRLDTGNSTSWKVLKKKN